MDAGESARSVLYLLVAVRLRSVRARISPRRELSSFSLKAPRQATRVLYETAAANGGVFYEDVVPLTLNSGTLKGAARERHQKPLLPGLFNRARGVQRAYALSALAHSNPVCARHVQQQNNCLVLFRLRESTLQIGEMFVLRITDASYSTATALKVSHSDFRWLLLVCSTLARQHNRKIRPMLQTDGRFLLSAFLKIESCYTTTFQASSNLVVFQMPFLEESP